jgi:hypothetical protein
MNPIFMAKLSSPNEFDNNGRFQLASHTVAQGAFTAPGALPRVPNPPAAAPVKVARVPMPRTAPEPKDDETPARQQEQPTTIAGLIGNLFGSSKPEPVPARMAASEPVTLRGATDLAAKPKQVAPVRTASAVSSAPVHTAPPPSAPAPAVAAPAPKPREAAPKAPVETVRAPASTASVQAAKAEPQRAPQPEIRTAYSTPPAASGGLLSGAQPVVPAGSFNSFR